MGATQDKARGWLDTDYKQRMLQDGTLAAKEIGIQVGPLKLVAVENTEHVHNVIVCTLCSCYPRMLLGLPPDWYKSKNYRSRVVREPRAVLSEFGTEISDQVEIRVHDSTADMRYLVMPLRPNGTDGWSEEKLADLATRDSMIGAATAETPAVAN
jgi:Nitrile hydratase, alpha chain